MHLDILTTRASQDEPLNGEPVVGDFDEDDEDEDGDIFGTSEDPNGDFDSDDEDGNIFGSGDDDDEEDEDDFGEEKDNGHAADRAAGLSKLQCGGEGVCNCNQNQCVVTVLLRSADATTTCFRQKFKLVCFAMNNQVHD